MAPAPSDVPRRVAKFARTLGVQRSCDRYHLGHVVPLCKASAEEHAADVHVVGGGVVPAEIEDRDVQVPFQDLTCHRGLLLSNPNMNPVMSD